MKREFPELVPIQEPWNSWALSDRSVLRVRLLLIRAVLEETKTGHKLGFSPHLIVVVDPPVELRGEPGPGLSGAEIAKVAKHDVGHVPVRTDAAIYRLEDGTLITTDVNVTRVRRADVNGPDGDPYYHVETDVKISVAAPEPLLRDSAFTSADARRKSAPKR